MFLKKQNNTILRTTHYSLQTRKGFTLVELLVVIGIIAVLFAVILIAINPAQRFKDSRNARRFSDVKAIIEATATYITDRKGTPPVNIPDYQCIGSKPATEVSVATANWKFESVSGGITNDSSGTNNDASTLESVASAKLNNGLTLIDPLQGASVPNSIGNPSNALALEGWIKLNNKLEPGTFDHNQALFDKGNYRMQLSGDNGKLEFETQTATSTWNTEYSSTNETKINSFVEYNGSLYVGIGGCASACGSVLKKGSTWMQVTPAYPSGSSEVKVLTVFNGFLSAGENSTGSEHKPKVYKFDGSLWTSTNLDLIVAGDTDILSLVRYKDKLYAGLSNASGGSVMVYDGTSWRISKQFSSTEALAVHVLTVFNGKLYAGTGRDPSDNDARLYEFNNTNWSQTTITGYTNGTKDGIHSLTEFNKELYIGIGGDSANDGEVWKLGEITQSGASYNLGTYAMGVYNGKLLAGWSASTQTADIYEWSSSNWNSVSFDISPPTNVREIRTMYNYQGKLYVGTSGSAINDALIRVYGSNNYISSQKSKWYTNVWYHVAGVYDGSNNQMKVFINGHLE